MAGSVRTAAHARGLLELSRGVSRVAVNGVQLKGERTIFGPFNAAVGAASSAAGASWSSSS